jgi:predicted ArsR family transcriptional regulator
MPLADPVRRSLYETVAAAGAPMDRDAAAQTAGIARALAAFHLDKLVAAGLLDAEFRRRGNRTGPGAGRPAKFYRRAAHVEVEVSLPPRRYDLSGQILAAALETVPDAVAAVREQAARAGRALVEAAEPGRIEDVVDLLARDGYEPAMDDHGVVRLRNCPFDALAERHRELVCGMNLAMLREIVATLPGHVAVLAPEPGHCCVVIVPVVNASGSSGRW